MTGLRPPTRSGARARLLALLLAAVGLVLGLGAVAATGDDGEDDGPYRVRATFHNAFAVVSDVDVRVAGARVGSVEAVDVDERGRAVVVLRIEDPAFQDFRTDAECSILPQSIIGERYVDCRPTQPRSPGSRAPGELRTARFDGEVQRLLPLDRTTQPIDLDLVGNLWQEPQRDRLTLLLSALGGGLAARGKDLDAALRAALPGLRDTNRVLSILRSQTGALRQMVTDGERALRPMADQRERLVGFLRAQADLQEAVGERNAELDENLRLLPATLRQLTPTMNELRDASSAMQPTVARLRQAAPQLRRLLVGLSAFSRTGTSTMKRLGASSDLGRRAIVAGDPIVGQLERLASRAAPVFGVARSLLESMRTTGGSRRLLEYAFYQGMAINGFDDVGHYLRVMSVLTRCSSYAEAPVSGCSTGTVEPGRPQTSRAAVRTASEAVGSQASLVDRLTAATLDGRDADRLLREAPKGLELDRLKRQVTDARRAARDPEALGRVLGGGSR